MRPTRPQSRRPNRRPSRADANRRQNLAFGLFLIASGCATSGLSAWAILADPYGMGVPAFGTLVMIGALAVIAGLFCALAEG